MSKVDIQDLMSDDPEYCEQIIQLLDDENARKAQGMLWMIAKLEEREVSPENMIKAIKELCHKLILASPEVALECNQLFNNKWESKE